MVEQVREEKLHYSPRNWLDNSVDFAALSETRFSGEGSIVEGDQNDGYTIFWRGYPEGYPRQHGVGLVIRNCHLRKIEEEPTFISERLMTLAFPWSETNTCFS